MIDPLSAIAPKDDDDAELALWLISEFGDDAHDELLTGAMPCG